MGAISVQGSGSLFLLLRLENQRFQMRRGLQCQHGFIRVLFIAHQLQLYGLTFKCRRVGLDLHVLLQKPVDGLLCFVQARFQRRLCMQLELLLDGTGQIPAEEYKGVLPMAFGM